MKCRYFYNFDRKICKILVINYCCDALLNILQKRRNTNNKLLLLFETGVRTARGTDGQV